MIYDSSSREFQTDRLRRNWDRDLSWLLHLWARPSLLAPLIESGWCRCIRWLPDCSKPLLLPLLVLLRLRRDYIVPLSLSAADLRNSRMVFSFWGSFAPFNSVHYIYGWCMCSSCKKASLAGGQTKWFEPHMDGQTNKQAPAFSTCRYRAPDAITTSSSKFVYLSGSLYSRVLSRIVDQSTSIAAALQLY